MKQDSIPRIEELYDPVLRALRYLGGEGSRQQILDEVIRIIDLPDELQSVMRSEEDDVETLIGFRVGFAQTHLKRSGFLENPSPGIWSLSEKGQESAAVDSKKVKGWSDRVRRAGGSDNRVEYEHSVPYVADDRTVVPTVDRFINPTLSVLHGLGGSGTYEEINEGIAEQLELTDEQRTVLHLPDQGNRTEFSYRASFARTFLRKYGLLDYGESKLWTLTKAGSSVKRVNPFAVILYAQNAIWSERLERERRILPDLTDIDATTPW